jgi:hypothetical protein
MLKKLIKYEFKSVSRKLIPLILGTLALAILTSILFTVNFRMLGSDSESVASSVFSMVLITLMIFSILAIVASIFVTWFILMQRYYKNFFGDEGYLTFTLPVKTSDHLTAKLISGVVWMLAGVLTVVVSVLLLVVFGTAENGQIMNTEVLRAISEAFADALDYVGIGNGIAYIIEVIVLLLIECTAQTMLFYLAITIGSIIAKKHKILASVGVYLGINAITGTIANIGVAIIFVGKDIKMLNELDFLFNSAHTMLILFILFYLVMGVVSFIISKYLLTKKLNLE